MESASRPFNIRAIIIYSLIALGLFGLVIGGIVWAKSQSAAQQSPSTVAQTDSQSGANQQPQQQDQAPAQSGAPQQNSPAQSTPSNLGTSAANTGASQVPATGASDWLLLAVSIAGVAFAAVLYRQSRLQLQLNR